MSKLLTNSRCEPESRISLSGFSNILEAGRKINEQKVVQDVNRSFNRSIKPYFIEEDRD